MTEPTAIRTSDGRWQVVAGGAVMAGPFQAMAEAWRWIDRRSGEPISPAEKRSDWSISKVSGGLA